MNIYHYSKVGDWQSIQSGSWQSRNVPGLGNNLRVCKDNFIDEGARDGAVFGLLEPEPANWVENSEFPVAWTYLTAHVGRLLLTYEPTEEIVEKSFIIDWAHMERFCGGQKDNLNNSQESRGSSSGMTRLDAERAYWASKVPLAEYISDPAVINELALPEVITMCVVPAEIIKIADTQPQLPDASPHERKKILRAIEYSPELEALRAYAV
ncbi:MAG TPA: hypothetical protein VF401_02310 [Candidatus Saccharimonadales bacterium]